MIIYIELIKFIYHESLIYNFLNLCFVYLSNSKQSKSSSSSYGTLTRKQSQQSISSGENRFVFRKRLFRSPREMPNDPVQVNLLYAQAVYSVVRVRL